MNEIVESNHEAILNYCNEAADAMRAGKPEHALTQLTRAFSLAYDSDSVRLTAYVLTALGHAYSQTGNLQRAEECFTSAYKSTRAEHPDLALMAAAGLARTLHAKGAQKDRCGAPESPFRGTSCKKTDPGTWRTR